MRAADAIVGVAFFSDSAPEQFGIFGRGFVSLFRVTGGDPWPDAALPLLGENGEMNFGTVAFMMSYIIIVNWTFLQVGVKQPIHDALMLNLNLISRLTLKGERGCPAQ